MGKSVALVTGASSGIGAEFARQLAAEGLDLVLVARRGDRLEALAKEIEGATGAASHIIARDLGRPESPEAIFKETQAKGLAVEWLVNNAGFGTNGALVDLPLDREREEIRLNVEALVALCHLYAPGMVARGKGQIVNLGSTGSFVPVPYMATYGATKAFVLSFSEALAEELHGKGVRVMALCPGATRTEFQEVAGVSRHVPEFSYMTAEAVVREAIAAAKRGKRTFVPGPINKLQAVSARLAPRSVLAGIAGSMFNPKKT
jgi:short-subunit dehydrogenase